MDVHIRPIRPDDKARLQTGLSDLSAESARQRFLSSKDHLSAGELRYLTEVDMVDHLALVAVDAAHGGRIVGVVRCVRDVSAPDKAEVAYVIADDFQGRGLATRMVRELADLAHARGIRRFVAIMAPDNEGARALALKVGEPISERIADAVRELEVAIRRCPQDAARPPRRTPRRLRGRTASRRSAEAPRRLPPRS